MSACKRRRIVSDSDDDAAVAAEPAGGTDGPVASTARAHTNATRDDGMVVHSAGAHDADDADDNDADESNAEESDADASDADAHSSGHVAATESAAVSARPAFADGAAIAAAFRGKLQRMEGAHMRRKMRGDFVSSDEESDEEEEHSSDEDDPEEMARFATAYPDKYAALMRERAERAAARAAAAAAGVAYKPADACDEEGGAEEEEEDSDAPNEYEKDGFVVSDGDSDSDASSHRSSSSSSSSGSSNANDGGPVAVGTCAPARGKRARAELEEVADMGAAAHRIACMLAGRRVVAASAHVDAAYAEFGRSFAERMRVLPMLIPSFIAGAIIDPATPMPSGTGETFAIAARGVPLLFRRFVASLLRCITEISAVSKLSAICSPETQLRVGTGDLTATSCTETETRIDAGEPRVRFTYASEPEGDYSMQVWALVQGLRRLSHPLELIEPVLQHVVAGVGAGQVRNYAWTQLVLRDRSNEQSICIAVQNALKAGAAACVVDIKACLDLYALGAVIA